MDKNIVKFSDVEKAVVAVRGQQVILDSDVAAFFAAEVEKYGAELDGVLYMISAPGTVEIAYPAGISQEIRTQYIDSFVADLLSYIETFDIQPATV